MSHIVVKGPDDRTKPRHTAQSWQRRVPPVPVSEAALKGGYATGQLATLSLSYMLRLVLQASAGVVVEHLQQLPQLRQLHVRQLVHAQARLPVPELLTQHELLSHHHQKASCEHLQP